MRARGTITAFDGTVLAVKARDGKDLALHMTDKTTVATAKVLALTDLKPGDYVGVTTMKRADGTPVAVEVHTLPHTVPAGYIPWDLQPDAMMTNANVTAAVQAAGGHELTLEYTGTTQKILVPEGTSIGITVPADPSFLKPAEYVFVSTQVDAEGKMTALRIQISKDGLVIRIVPGQKAWQHARAGYVHSATEHRQAYLGHGLHTKLLEHSDW